MRKVAFFYIFLFCLILAISFAWTSVDYDFWARLLQGFAVIETGKVMTVDPFSYVPTHLWIDHEWGSGVIFAAVQNLFGYSGQMVLKAVLIFFTLFFIIRIIQVREVKYTKVHNILFFLVWLFFFEIVILTGIRCHFFTFLLYTVFLYLLEEVRINGKDKLLYLMPVLMLFWANVHGGCVSGLGLLVIYAVGEFLNKKSFKKYLLTFLGCSAVIFINPYGFEYIKFLLSATTMERAYITEWHSLFSGDLTHQFKSKIYFIMYLAVFAGSLLKTLKNKEKFDYTKFLVVATSFYLAFSHIKHVPFMFITTVAFLYDDFFFFFNKLMQKIRQIFHINSEKFTEKFVLLKEILVYCLIVAEIFALVKIHNKVMYSHMLTDYPVKITEFMKINKMNGKILNKFAVGSYLSYKLYPQNLIFMDGRYEEVYYDETFLYNWNFYNFNSDNEKWDKIFEVYGEPDYIILDKKDYILYFKNELKNYMEIFKDNNFFLFVRKDLVKKQYLQPKNDDKYYIDNYFERLKK